MAKILDTRLGVFPFPLLFLAALAAFPGRSASGAEITAFAIGASLGETWNTGYGGMLTITFFSLVHGELEGCWQSSALPDTSVSSGAAKAYLGPTIGAFVPYAGLGAGVYRESLPGKSDQGTYGLLFAGAKLKFPMGLVIRGEYQWVSLPEAAPIKLDHRYFFALGLSL